MNLTKFLRAINELRAIESVSITHLQGGDEIECFVHFADEADADASSPYCGKRSSLGPAITQYLSLMHLDHRIYSGRRMGPENTNPIVCVRLDSDYRVQHLSPENMGE